jgi:hypothetical protein
MDKNKPYIFILAIFYFSFTDNLTLLLFILRKLCFFIFMIFCFIYCPNILQLLLEDQLLKYKFVIMVYWNFELPSFIQYKYI